MLVYELLDHWCLYFYFNRIYSDQSSGALSCAPMCHVADVLSVSVVIWFDGWCLCVIAVSGMVLLVAAFACVFTYVCFFHPSCDPRVLHSLPR